MRKHNQSGQSTLAVVGGIFLAILVIAGITFGGWALGWWFTNENAQREAHVIRNGYSNQQTLREEISRKLSDVQTITVQITQLGTSDPASTPALVAQRKAVVNIVCGDAEQITGDPLPADQADFVTANCSLGAISPNSQYNS